MFLFSHTVSAAYVNSHPRFHSRSSLTHQTHPHVSLLLSLPFSLAYDRNELREFAVNAFHSSAVCTTISQYPQGALTYNTGWVNNCSLNSGNRMRKFSDSDEFRTVFPGDTPYTGSMFCTVRLAVQTSRLTNACSWPHKRVAPKLNLDDSFLLRFNETASLWNKLFSNDEMRENERWGIGRSDRATCRERNAGLGSTMPRAYSTRVTRELWH